MAARTSAGKVSSKASFNYASLTASSREQVRAAAKCIREKLKRTLHGIVDVGLELLKVKDALAHGQFGPWLLVEFGGSDRTACNFMEVAEMFGPKSEIISDLAIAPTAAYLLAAPTAPFEAREAALKRAKCGETITVAVAKEILGESRLKSKRRPGKQPVDRLWHRVAKILERVRERWDLEHLPDLARHLWEAADLLDRAKQGGVGAKRH